jgi:phenylalanyl-tRNA synthetase beta subunit
VVIEHSNHTSLAWIELASKSTFSNARSNAEIISKRLELDGTPTEDEDPLFIPGRCVQIKTENTTLKYGEIHPQTLEKYELDYPAIGGEIIW